MQKVRILIKNFLFLILVSTFIYSCSDSRKIAYFSDAVKDSTIVASRSIFEPTIQKKDILSIIVTSRNNAADEVFNAPNQPLIKTQLQTAGYMVGENGKIDFPLIGEVDAEGLTPAQLGKKIQTILSDQQLLLDPIVKVNNVNFRVTVLGEVNRPGVISVPNEQISILEAIGAAGDLTIYGLRDNVMLIRQVGEEKIIKRLDLNAMDLLSSPFYYLKTNDILYIEPAKTRIAATDRTLQLLPIIMSGLSFITVMLLRYKNF